ncbi:MAG: methyltransferase domain-containing protein, partial [Candidatus Omnitrophica bacterium]|nr:methyltransferase domain-containing protein [Candidatus Omnitrophota bacterium]
MDLSELTGNTIRHPWEVARVHALKRILDHYGLLKNNFSYLDVGCGDAFALSYLLDGHLSTRMDGIDIHLSAVQAEEFSKNRPYVSLFNTFEALSNRSYDIIFMLDVIEHVQEDRDLVKDIIRKHLNTGGHLVITVPAVDWLFSRHDTYLGHYRRYTKKSLRACLNGLGTAEAGHGFLFASLLPVRFYEWGLEKIIGHKSGTQGAGHW